MNILAIDTAYGFCAVTLKTADGYYSASKPALRQQAELLLPLVEQVLTQAKLTVHCLNMLAFSAGPASFTGVRLALSAVQGLAFADNLPIVAVNSLQALAQNFYNQYQHDKILVCTNAHMGQLFWAGFKVDRQAHMEPCYPAVLVNVRALPTVVEDGWTQVGNGWKLCQVETIYDDFLPCSAAAITDLALLAYAAGLAQNVATVLPVYLRTAAAWKN